MYICVFLSRYAELCSGELHYGLPNSSGKGLQTKMLWFPLNGIDDTSEKSAAGIAKTIANTQIRDAVKMVSGFALKPATWRRIGLTMAQYLREDGNRLYRKSSRSSFIPEINYFR